MRNTVRRLSDALRDSRQLRRQVYQVCYGTVGLVAGIIVYFSHQFAVRLEHISGALVIVFGLVLAVLALIRAVKWIRARQFVAFAWVSIGFVVVLPLLVLVIQLTRR